MQGGTATVNIALTINGAKNDVIAIKNSSDVTIATCTFDPGSTQGTIRINVPVGGQSYKFVSSVAKDTTTGTSDYEKTIFISDANNQTVNVYPKNALYWYGNYIVEFARESIQTNLSKTDLTNAMEIHWNTTQIGSGAYYTTNAINLSSYSKIKLNCTGVSGTIRWFGEIASPNANSNYTDAIDNSNTSTGIKELSVSSLSTIDYIGIILGGSTDSNAYITVSAFWLEDDHEDYFTINGAKEDVITIKDSSNQTIATCNFNTGKSYGYISKLLLLAGQSYKFISSVAKDTIVGTSNYTKTIYLEGNERELNIMPKGTLYWYGNENKAMSNGIWTNAMADVTKNTNSLRVNYPANSYKYLWYCTNNSIDLSQYTKIHAAINIRTLPVEAKVFLYSSSSRDIGSGTPITHNLKIFNSATSGMEVVEAAFSINEQNYIGIRSQFYNEAIDVELGALWLENEFENSIRINGAKEDIIAIRDSNNQLVTTCIFGTGKTYGYVSKDLLSSGLYSFTSSVAKDTTTGTSDYSKVITLDGTESEVNIMPDGALYWYGNEIVPWDTSGYTNGSTNCYGGVKNTNDIYVAQTYDLSNIATYVGTVNPVSFDGYTIIKMRSKASAFISYSSALGINTAKDIGGNAYARSIIQTGSDTAYHIGSADISTITASNYIFFTAGGNKRGGYCNAIWLE